MEPYWGIAESGSSRLCLRISKFAGALTSAPPKSAQFRRSDSTHEIAAIATSYTHAERIHFCATHCRMLRVIIRVLHHYKKGQMGLRQQRRFYPVSCGDRYCPLLSLAPPWIRVRASRGAPIITPVSGVRLVEIRIIFGHISHT